MSFDLKFGLNRKKIDLTKFNLNDKKDRLKLGKITEDVIFAIASEETSVLRPGIENIQMRKRFLTVKEFAEKFKELTEFYKMLSERNFYGGDDIRKNIPDLYLVNEKVFYEVKTTFKIEVKALPIYKRIQELTGIKILIIVKPIETINDNTFWYCPVNEIIGSRRVIMPSGDEGYELEKDKFSLYSENE